MSNLGTPHKGLSPVSPAERNANNKFRYFFLITNSHFQSSFHFELKYNKTFVAVPSAAHGSLFKVDFRRHGAAAPCERFFPFLAPSCTLENENKFADKWFSNSIRRVPNGLQFIYRRNIVTLLLFCVCSNM